MAEEAAVVLVAILAKRLRKRKLSKRKHLFWVRKWLQNREKLGAYHQLLQELRSLDTSSYRNFLMDSTSFEELLRKVGAKISLQNTVMRDAIPAGERLAVTLRFLATGECHLYI